MMKAMDTGSRFLFVYGTLRPGSGHRMADVVAAAARCVGPARVRGQLHDLGPYPAMIEPAGPEDWVHGDLFELHDPEPTLALLDDYEGAAGRPPLFDRRLAPIILDSGDELRAWIYLYRGCLRGARPITHGDYLRSRK